jgi:carboxyl-terminal processing protease
VSDGVVVSVGRDPETAQVYRSRDDALAEDVPLAVLVDAGSASASEIVAAALQDLGRAEIVGETTFGKGTVQTIADLSDDRGVKFTTARYYTPSGDSIDGVGVEPDRIVAAGDGEDDPQLTAAQEAASAALARAN